MRDLAYAAGCIDCDGTICYTGRNPHAIVSLGNTNPAIPEWLQERFGGNIYSREHKDHPKWKGLQTWMINGMAAVEFLKKIRPWLIQKQAQADLVIEASEATARTKGNWRLTSKMRQLRADYKSRINVLNRRGVA